MAFRNVYEDEERAQSYAQLGFPGTYYLAYRDLPALLARHACGRRALDFGCGTGRSTRFLREQGYAATGVDISPQMIVQARTLDPAGDYRLVEDARYEQLGQGGFDVVLAAFTFDNIPGIERRTAILAGLRDLLAAGGVIVLLDSTPELYRHEWASFSTAEFAYNRTAGSGDLVSTRMKDVTDARPVNDVLWTHEDYLALFRATGLSAVEVQLPLGRTDEPVEWVNETRVAPWVVYVLRKPTSTSASTSRSVPGQAG